MIRALILTLALCGPAAAQDVLPSWFRVTGVAADDVLNIRERPDPGSAVIGTLAPDATGVEVVAVDGDWAVVNNGEQSGYAALRYLARETGPVWNALQTPLACFGTEPFWSFKVDPAAGIATLVASDDLTGATSTITTAWPGTPWAPVAAFSIAEGLAVLTPAACSDGMSDRRFGIALDLFLTQPETLRLSGCCSLGQP